MANTTAAQHATSGGQPLWVSITDPRATFKKIDWKAFIYNDAAIDNLGAAINAIEDGEERQTLETDWTTFISRGPDQVQEQGGFLNVPRWPPGFTAVPLRATAAPPTPAVTAHTPALSANQSTIPIQSTASQPPTSGGQPLWVSPVDPRASFKNIDWKALIYNDAMLDRLYDAVLATEDDEERAELESQWLEFIELRPHLVQANGGRLRIPRWPLGFMSVPLRAIAAPTPTTSSPTASAAQNAAPSAN